MAIRTEKARFKITQCGHFVNSYKSLSAAKTVVRAFARKHRIFSYRAVDTETGEIWRFDPDLWKLVLCHEVK